MGIPVQSMGIPRKKKHASDSLAWCQNLNKQTSDRAATQSQSDLLI